MMTNESEQFSRRERDALLNALSLGYGFNGTLFGLTRSEMLALKAKLQLDPSESREAPEATPPVVVVHEHHPWGPRQSRTASTPTPLVPCSTASSHTTEVPEPRERPAPLLPGTVESIARGLRRFQELHPE